MLKQQKRSSHPAALYLRGRMNPCAFEWFTAWSRIAADRSALRTPLFLFFDLRQHARYRALRQERQVGAVLTFADQELRAAGG